MIPIIHAQQLEVRYQQTLALSNVTLDIPQHVRAAIVGPNGAGKSTFIKALLQLVPATYQQLELFQQPLEKVRQRIAYVPQSAQVNWQFPTTVLDVVLMGITSNRLGFQRIQPQQREQAHAALEKMALLDLKNRQISQLSGGQKQRVFLARAIAQNADLYLLDEPLAGVDIQSETLIMDYLQQLQQQGKTSLTVHHDLNTVPEYFDYVVFLNHGLIAHGAVSSTFTEQNITKTYSQKVGTAYAV
ncbi:MAG: metal ABC transporter ATP-binding protein [Aerococcaceae bacterium]|nr:metal ABC transporter ATP-binding protein [Aerococcaceae bacterium]